MVITDRRKQLRLIPENPNEMRVLRVMSEHDITVNTENSFELGADAVLEILGDTTAFSHQDEHSILIDLTPKNEYYE